MGKYIQSDFTIREILGHTHTLNYIINSEDSEEVNIKNGFITTRVNLRSTPEINDNIICVYERNQEIVYEDFNNEWVKVYITDNEFGYIRSEYISNEKVNYIDYTLPSNSGFKSYMPYKAITSKSSSQYRLQLDAYTNEETGIRMINGRYCVALGSYFNCKIGQEFDLMLENGVVIPCIMGDEKADKDTDNNNLFTKDNGCATEFIVDSKILPKQIKKYGDISYAYEGWDSPVSTIRVYE